MKSITRPFAGLFTPILSALLTVFAAASAHAHHPTGGNPVTSPVDGFLSGVAHPVIGIDHLVMIVAIGVLAAAMRPGFLLFAVFVLAAMGGTSLHLLGMYLPGSEAFVSLSVLAVGVLLALRKTPNRALVLAICAVGGLLHGYAYAEAIFGAEPASLVAYLAGFTVVQLTVAAVAYAIAKSVRRHTTGDTPALRPAGFVVAGAGFALLATQIAALAFPISS